MEIYMHLQSKYFLSIKNSYLSFDNVVHKIDECKKMQESIQSQKKKIIMKEICSNI